MKTRKITRTIDGKPLKVIAKESGISYGTIAYRYDHGARTYADITAPIRYNHNDDNRLDMCTDKGRRFLQAVMKRNMTLAQVVKASSVDKTVIYKFMYLDSDISSLRLAKICGAVGVSMDYVMGLKGER